MFAMASDLTAEQLQALAIARRRDWKGHSNRLRVVTAFVVRAPVGRHVIGFLFIIYLKACEAFALFHPSAALASGGASERLGAIGNPKEKLCWNVPDSAR